MKTRTEMTDKDRKLNQPYDIDVIPAAVHPTKTAKLMNIFIGAALVIIAISLFIFLRWSLAPTNILVVKNSPFPARIVQDPTGETGGIVFLKAKYCKNTNVAGQVRMSYVSKNREVFLPIAKEQSPLGCADRVVPVVIPIDLQHDTYVIKFHVSYNINPVKTGVIVSFESQPIVVGGPASK